MERIYKNAMFHYNLTKLKTNSESNKNIILSLLGRVFQMYFFSLQSYDASIPPVHFQDLDPVVGLTIYKIITPKISNFSFFFCDLFSQLFFFVLKPTQPNFYLILKFFLNSKSNKIIS